MPSLPRHSNGFHDFFTGAGLSLAGQHGRRTWISRTSSRRQTNQRPGRQAVRAAVALGVAARGNVTVMRALPTSHAMRGVTRRSTPHASRLSRRTPPNISSAGWRPDLPALGPMPPRVSYGARPMGIPANRDRPLRRAARAPTSLVVGRKPRSRLTRLLMGDTADAVARRSTIPCLFVRGRGRRCRAGSLAAVDGSERGDGVLEAADDFARQMGAKLQVLTVERVHAGEPASLAAEGPGNAQHFALRRVKVQDVPAQATGSPPRRPGRRKFSRPIVRAPRRCARHRLSPRRAGPGVIEAGSTARRLVHEATCAVLTVPL